MSKTLELTRLAALEAKLTDPTAPSYLPSTAAEAAAWQPHAWVVAAIERALGGTPSIKPAAAVAPNIGELWPAQGGRYAGVARGEDGAPDQHLVMCETPADTKMDWESAKRWAAALRAPNHADWRLPTRFESALLYAHLREFIDTDYWYWTATPYGDGYAWGQNFGGGTQGSYGTSFKARALAVRRFSA
jgi:hypothetical protein